jgi:hypothetical protein
LLKATLLSVLAALLAVGLIGTAAAAPKDNGKVDIITVDCEGLGQFEVITKENSGAAFGPDGEVYVAKRFEFDQTITVTTFDGETFGPIDDSFSEGSNGKGFEGRLIPCTFPADFSDTFPLSEEDAEFFGIPSEYIGTDVTVEATGTGTAWVITPGR